MKLLEDLREIFNSPGCAALPSATVLERLCALPESPWASYEFNERKLAQRLRGYGIRPKQHRTTGNDKQFRGYALADLADAFARYLPAPDRAEQRDRHKPSQRHSQSETAGHTANDAVTHHDPVTHRSVTANGSVTTEKPPGQDFPPPCDGATDRDTPTPTTTALDAATKSSGSRNTNEPPLHRRKGDHLGHQARSHGQRQVALLRASPVALLLVALRQYGPDIAHRSRQRLCCWCETDAQPAWIDDFDSGLGICRSCARSVGEARLARESCDFGAWERDAWTESWRDPGITLDEIAETGWSPEHFVKAEEVER